MSVQNGEVTLSGTVESRQEKFYAENMADSVSGVTDVINQLRVVHSNAVEGSPLSNEAGSTSYGEGEEKSGQRLGARTSSSMAHSTR